MNLILEHFPDEKKYEEPTTASKITLAIIFSVILIK